MRSSFTADSPSSPTISLPPPPAIPSSLSTLSSSHEASSAEEEQDSAILHPSTLNQHKHTSATPLKSEEKELTEDDSQPLDLHDLSAHQSAGQRVDIGKKTRQEQQRTTLKEPGSKQRHRKSGAKKLLRRLDASHMNVQVCAYSHQLHSSSATIIVFFLLVL